MMQPELFSAFSSVSSVAAGSLVAAVWQGVLLACAAAAGMRMLPKMPAGVRFAIWFGVFGVVTALPLVAVFGPGGHPVAASAPRTWVSLDPRWSEVLLAVWLVASAVRGTILLAAAFRVRSLWRRARRIDIAFDGLTAGGAGLARIIQVCASDEVDRPSVIGFFAPKILIPTWLVNKLTPQEMEHVVLHEAGHLRRADDWLNLLQKLALVVFPLNPALVWVERRLCFERELACDERVLAATGAPKAYASCLASLAEHRMTRRGLGLVMGALGRESELGQRVRRILSGGDRMRPAHARLVMGAAMVALVAGAVGLERCPQLVGFAEGDSGAQAMAASPRGAAYQAVMFRPGRVGDATYSGARAYDLTVRQPIREAGAGPALSRVKQEVPQSFRKTSGRKVMIRTTNSQMAEQASAQVVETRWVVMTSWNGGSRVVMTSLTATVQPRPENAGVAAQQRPVEMVPAEQVYPYAAVPVRGGWLVIQM